MFFVDSCTDASFLQEQSNSDLIMVPVFVTQFLFLLCGEYIVLGHLSAQGMLGQYQRNVQVNTAQSSGFLPEDSAYFSELHRSISLPEDWYQSEDRTQKTQWNSLFLRVELHDLIFSNLAFCIYKLDITVFYCLISGAFDFFLLQQNKA